MPDLIETPSWPFENTTLGGVTLQAADIGRLTSIAPFSGAAENLSEAMKAAHGLRFPKSNSITGRAGTRSIWFGRDMALLAGPDPDPSLAEHAALTDQTDAWVAVELSGADSQAVLARLVPVDLGNRAFPRNATARTLLGHLNVSLTRTGDDAFLILVFRSMARTLHHELTKE